MYSSVLLQQVHTGIIKAILLGVKARSHKIQVYQHVCVCLSVFPALKVLKQLGSFHETGYRFYNTETTDESCVLIC